MRRTVLLLALASTAVPALAGDDEDPTRGLWAIDLPPGQAPPALPGQRDGSKVGAGVCLWLPSPWRTREGAREIPHVDALMHAAALFPLEKAVCAVELYGLVDLARERPLRWEEATLALPDGTQLACAREGAMGRFQAGRKLDGEREGTGLVRYLLLFPGLAPEVAELRLAVPAGEPDAAPLVLRFFRWKERLARAEAAMAAWQAHVRRPEVQAASAIGVWTECQPVRDLLACGEAAAVPLFLRELARGARCGPDEAVPHFALLHVLARTAWGKSEGIPEAGTPADAARIVRRWAERGGPSAPGVTPPR